MVLIKKETKQGKFDEPYDGPFEVQKILSETNVLIKKGNKLVKAHINKLIKAKANYQTEKT